MTAPESRNCEAVGIRLDAGVLVAALDVRAAARGTSVSRWRNLLTHAVLDSTQAEAARLEAGGAPDGTVVIASEQTDGRGRRNRSWESPPGAGVYLTALMRPPPARTRRAGGALPAVGFSLASAIAACEAVRRMGAADAELKWPNDVMSGGRKLAGLLVETRFAGERLRAVLIGCGLNVSRPEGGLPAELADRATSLRESFRPGESLPGPPRLEEAAVVLLDAMDEWGVPAESDDLPRLVAAFESRCSMARGARVTVHESSGCWAATTEGLGPDGSLRVRAGDGAARELRLSEEITVREERACCS